MAEPEEHGGRVGELEQSGGQLGQWRHTVSDAAFARAARAPRRRRSSSNSSAICSARSPATALSSSASDRASTPRTRGPRAVEQAGDPRGEPGDQQRAAQAVRAGRPGGGSAAFTPPQLRGVEPVGERLVEVARHDLLAAVEVGDRAGHPQHPVVAAAAEVQAVARREQPRGEGRVERH